MKPRTHGEKNDGIIEHSDRHGRDGTWDPRCPGQTHLERSAPHRLPRPQQACAVFDDDVQHEHVRREDGLGVRAHSRPCWRLRT